MKSKTS